MGDKKFSIDFFSSTLRNKKSKLLIPLLLSILLFSCGENPSGQIRENRFNADEVTSNFDTNLMYRRRDYIDYWVDIDGDCRNLRHEMLMRQSLEEVVFKNTHNCIVEKGLWVDPYTNKSMRLASDLDVDHVIPLAYAHHSGGLGWSKSEKRKFAMDEMNLLLVDDGENNRKGARGPSQYLPIESFHCNYAEIWQTVSEKYNLELPVFDQRTLTSILNRCLM